MDDILAAVRDGRSPLALTERREHLDRLAAARCLAEGPAAAERPRHEVQAAVLLQVGRRLSGHVVHVSHEVVEVGHFVGAVRLHADFVAGEAEVAHDEVVGRERLVDQGLEVALVLLAVGETAADEGDIITLLEGEVLGRDGGESEQGQQEGGQLAHGFLVLVKRGGPCREAWSVRGGENLSLFQQPAKGNVPPAAGICPSFTVKCGRQGQGREQMAEGMFPPT